MRNNFTFIKLSERTLKSYKEFGYGPLERKDKKLLKKFCEENKFKQLINFNDNED